MATGDIAPGYRVWGADNTAQGPVELPTLVSWIKARKVGADSWVFLDESRAWLKAAQVPELKMFFHQTSPARSDQPPAGAHVPVIKPGSLRRMKIFADMDEEQLELFVRYTEIVNFRQFSHVVRKGDHADAMYLVLEGELRALSLIDGKETTLSTIAVGESFGEVSLLDHGPRSVDVVANRDSVLLKISAGGFEKLLREAPQSAAVFLYALSKSVAVRLRHLTKRYEDSIHFSRMAGAVH